MMRIGSWRSNVPVLLAPMPPSPTYRSDGVEESGWSQITEFLSAHALAVGRSEDVR